MALVQDEHVVQACAADAPEQPVDVGGLPWTPWGGQHVFDPHLPHPRPKGGAIGAVPIAQQIPRGLVPRAGVDDLLGGPLRGGVLGDVDRPKLSALVGEDHQHEEHLTADRWDHQEVQGDQLLDVMLEEGLPRRRRRLAGSSSIRLHR